MIIFLIEFFSKIKKRYDVFLERRLRPCWLKKVARAAGAEFISGQNVRLGKNCRFLLSPGSRLVLGADVRIRDNCLLDLHPGALVEFGAGSYLGPGSEIFARNKIIIGSRVLLAQNCAVLDFNHQWDKSGVLQDSFRFKSVKIGNRAWLGLRVVVLAGVEIGEGAVVGAQEVVRGNVPDHTLWLGDRPVKKIN